MENEAIAFDRVTCRKTFNRIGYAYFAFQLLFAGVAYLVSFIFNRYSISVPELAQWLINYLPMYLLAVPATALIISKIPPTKPEPGKITAGKYMILLLIGWGLTIVGSLFGRLLSFIINAITGLNTTDALNATLQHTNIFIVIFFTVIMAPIVEEFLCRKLIVDHTLQYGEKTAIIVSGLIFGLIHGNFFQFFYAFILGMLMAYIYIKTGKLRYTILFHMIVNTLGGLVPTLLIQSIGIDTDKLLHDSAAYMDTYMAAVKSHIPQFLMLILFEIIEYGAAIAGIVLFFVFIKKIIATVKPMNIPKGERFKCIILNPGMILFLLATTADFIAYLILNQY